MMNQEFLVKLLKISALTALTFTLAACASSPSTQEPAAVEETAAVVEIEPWEGDPMDMPLDGSSPDAFDTSMARFAAHADENQVEGLNKAIDYLTIYDIASKGDRNKLITRLDGMTPKEVMNLVSYRTPGPGKSAIEKDAADLQKMDIQQ